METRVQNTDTFYIVFQNKTPDIIIRAHSVLPKRIAAVEGIESCDGTRLSLH